MTSQPLLSVIIPCHNNGRVLPWALQAIRACALENVEIICVDDHSAEALEPIARRYGARYERMNSQVPGDRARVRQLGHHMARGEVTFYLDGDIVPEPRIFKKAVCLHNEHPRVAIKFAVYSIAEKDHREALTKLAERVIAHDLPAFGPLVRKHCGIDTRPLPRRLRDRPTKFWMLLASHCMSVERRSVESVGGWDQEFRGWGEEDLELAYRLHLAGLQFLYPHRKHGAAYHLDHPVNWSANVASLERNLQRFLQKHPQMWAGRRGLLQMFLRENGLPDIAAILQANQSQVAAGEELIANDH